MNYSIIIFVFANGIVGLYVGRRSILHVNIEAQILLFCLRAQHFFKYIFSEENPSGATHRHHAGVGLKVFNDFLVSEMPKKKHHQDISIQLLCLHIDGALRGLCGPPYQICLNCPKLSIPCFYDFLVILKFWFNEAITNTNQLISMSLNSNQNSITKH